MRLLEIRRPDVALTIMVGAGCMPLLAAYGPFDSVPAVVLAALLSWALVSLGALLVVAIAWRRVLPAGVTAIALLAHAAFLGPLVVGTEPSGSQSTVVMTANLRLGRADAEAVVNHVRARHVEILALQELTPEAVEWLRAAGLDSVLPHSLVDAGAGSSGTGLWASRPLTRAPAWPTSKNSTAGVTIIGGRAVTLMVLHPSPPGVGKRFTWHRDFAMLRDAADRDPDAARTVVLGDLNASVHHAQLRALMAERWRDAAEVSGAGIVRTWSPSPSLPALVDLDHVLVPPGVGVRDVAVLPVKGSDHRAVLAELAFVAPRRLGLTSSAARR